MAKGYLIASVIIVDPHATEKYIAATSDVLAKFGARHVVDPQTATIKEGRPGTRIVVFEFDSLERAQEFWDSPEYASCKILRKDAMEGDFIIVEGIA